MNETKLKNLREEIKNATSSKEKYKLTCNLIELLLFKDLVEAEKLAKDLIRESKIENNFEYNFKGKTLLIRIYRATKRIDEGLDLAEELRQAMDDSIVPNEQFIVYNSLVNLYIEKLDYAKAIEVNNLVSSTIYNKLSERFKAHHHTDKGKVFEKLSYVDLAVEELEKSIDLFNKTSDLNGLAKALFSTGLLLLSQDEYLKAEQYFQETLRIDLELNANNPAILLQSYALIARCAFMYGDFVKGNWNCEEALRLAKTFDYNDYVNRVNSDKVEFLLLEKRFDECIQLAQSLIFNEDFKKDTFFYNKTIAALGFAYDKLANVVQAIEFFEKYIQLNKDNQEDNRYLEVYEALARNYEILNDYKSSNGYYKKYIELILEREKEKSKRSLEQFNVKFETAQKEKEAEGFKAESLKFQLQSLRSQMNPHFVFNAISSISNDMNLDNIDKSKNLLKSFARLMRANLDFAEQETISLEEEIVFLKDYLKLEQNRLGNKLTYEILHADVLDLEFIEIPSMLIQPFVENAIKHGIYPLAGEGNISIRFEEMEEFLIVYISDNGVGREQAAINKKNQERHIGKSTEISATRLALLDSQNQDKIKVEYRDLKNESGIALGTEVQLKIKL